MPTVTGQTYLGDAAFIPRQSAFSDHKNLSASAE
jgi:hypothetical protein